MNVYVSDLDGTLLSSSKKITKRSVDIINNLIAEGMKFSIATARSRFSAENFLNELNLEIPLILLNGIFVYDPVNKKYLMENYLDSSTTEKIVNLYEEHGIDPWIFATDKYGVDKIYYKKVVNQGQREFIDERVRMGDKRFTKVNEFPDLSEMKIAHINTISAKTKQMNRLYNILLSRNDVLCHSYEDVYLKGYYLMETMNYGASKKEGIKFLKKYLGADKMICFGDNYNDIGMFEASDEKYTVKNAVNDLKKIADDVIASNDNDGVALYLQSKLSSLHNSI